MVAEPGRPGMDMVMAQSFQMIEEVTAGMSSEEETLKRTMFENAACDQCGAQRATTGVEEKEEDSVASFPATLDNTVDHIGPSGDSASICHTDALNMETMNRLDELSREIENCWFWMNATYLDDEQWCRVYDETSLEDSLAPVDRDSVQRPDVLERNIIELVEETQTWVAMEDKDNRDLHGNRVDHVNCSWLLVSSLRQWTKRRSARVLAVMSRRARHWQICQL